MKANRPGHFCDGIPHDIDDLKGHASSSTLSLGQAYEHSTLALNVWDILFALTINNRQQFGLNRTEPRNHNLTVLTVWFRFRFL